MPGADRRPYRSPHRAAQAAATRRAVIEAATDRFNTAGWSGTTLADVARDAGVAVETIYATFGSKAQLLDAALDVAVVGDDQASPLADRPEFTAFGEGDLATRVRAVATLLQRINARTARLVRAYQQAAEGNPELAKRWQEIEEGRWQTVAAGVGLALGRTPKNDETTSVWILTSGDGYLGFLGRPKATDASYRRWLAAGLLALLSDAARS